MKMTKNDHSWKCDTCGRLIRPDDPGWVEWIAYEDENGKVRGRDLRLVHNNASLKHGTHGCQFDQRKEFRKDHGTPKDDSLEEFLGPDGLMRLIAMIRHKELPTQDVLTMMMRLHIPGYEQARDYLEGAFQEGIIDWDFGHGCPRQIEIEVAMRYARRLVDEV